MLNTRLSDLQQCAASRACCSERLPSTLLPSVFVIHSGFIDSLIKTSIFAYRWKQAMSFMPGVSIRERPSPENDSIHSFGEQSGDEKSEKSGFVELLRVRFFIAMFCC